LSLKQYIEHSLLYLINCLCKCRTLIGLEYVSAIGVDLVRGQKTLSLIKEFGIPDGKVLFAGVVDGRNIWANDLAASLDTLQELSSILGKGNLCSLTFSLLRFLCKQCLCMKFLA
jgi:hypothetical protein